jgi:membrane fusion protein (multidrug efflux system)
MKKKIALFTFILLILIGVYGLYKYIVFNKNYASSNAVFVKSDSLTFLSFKLPGKIEKIYVNEGDKIKKGELLAKLETKELEIQKKELVANIKALEDKIKATKIQKEKLTNDIDTNLKLLENEKDKLQKNIEAMAFSIDAMRYKLEKLKNDYQKFKRLYLQHKVSKEKYENVKVAFYSLKDQISAQERKFDALLLNNKTIDLKIQLNENNKKELKRLQKSIEAQENQLKALNEKLALVNQNIKNSYIYSPIDGAVAKKFANDYEVVDAGMKVLSVVNPRDLYVLDLLEETKLKGIKPGCKAIIHIDALDKDFEGTVSEILPASAATFALVPRDISSGEFTKLAQRFYVKIKFDKAPVRVLVGMSGEVQIARCNLH